MKKRNDMIRFKDRVVLITGAVRGIGWGISRRFAGEGARVVINDIDEGIVRSRSQELNEQGFQALGIRADVSKGTEVEGMINKVLDRFGNLDVLVNNAAVFYPSVPIVDIEEEEWDKVMAVNVRGALNCAKFAARYMIERKRGRIVNFSSLIGKTGKVIFSTPGNPSWAAYATSKAAIASLTKSMAHEWAPFNVYVNAVAPSYIQTEKTTPDQAESVKALAPLGRVGTPEDVASAVLFLASDEASYITGEILDVNGGIMMD